MALFRPHYYEKLFAPFFGKRVGYFILDGNVGDELNHQAALALFEHFDIDVIEARPWSCDRLGKCVDELVISGGGNMGCDFYKKPFSERRVALGLGLSTTVFPQTFISNDEDLSGYKKIFVREKRSLSFSDQFELAPDLAMGLINIPAYGNAEEGLGVFLRRDVEAGFTKTASLGDPAYISATYQEYLELASRFEHIVTDRLHFAISALLIGRRATLLPNSYWKNQAMFETWLHKFDCGWKDFPDVSGVDESTIPKRLLHRLAGAPSVIVDWAARPMRQRNYKLFQQDGRPAIRSLDGRTVSKCNEHAQLILVLCDGTLTVAEILDTLCELYPEDSLTLARDLQRTLISLSEQGVILVDDAKEGNDRSRTERLAPAGAKIADMEVVVDPFRTVSGRLIKSASLTNHKGEEHSIWFEVDADHSDLTSSSADPFLLVALLPAMRRACNIVVKGAPVSPGLLGNLERYQQAWCRWRDDLTQIEIRAESEVAPENSSEKAALMAFSGGVDSCFSAYEYLWGSNVKHQSKVAGGLLIQGFDIPCESEFDSVFDQAAKRSERILQDAGLTLLTIKTNARVLAAGRWLDYHGLMLGAALNFFKARYRTGVIPATMPYEVLMPLGSNPVTDPLMSCRYFDMIHHGAHADRIRKIAVVGQWKAARENLRVCWEGPELDGNCGSCAKCVLTHLGFWVNGIDAPCFAVSLSSDLVEHALRNRILAPLDWLHVHSILTLSKERGLRAPWLSTLEQKISAAQQI